MFCSIVSEQWQRFIPCVRERCTVYVRWCTELSTIMQAESVAICGYLESNFLWLGWCTILYIFPANINTNDIGSLILDMPTNLSYPCSWAQLIVQCVLSVIASLPQPLTKIWLMARDVTTHLPNWLNVSMAVWESMHKYRVYAIVCGVVIVNDSSG